MALRTRRCQPDWSTRRKRRLSQRRLTSPTRRELQRREGSRCQFRACAAATSRSLSSVWVQLCVSCWLALVSHLRLWIQECFLLCDSVKLNVQRDFPLPLHDTIQNTCSPLPHPTLPLASPLTHLIIAIPLFQNITTPIHTCKMLRQLLCRSVIISPLSLEV